MEPKQQGAAQPKSITARALTESHENPPRPSHKQSQGSAARISRSTYKNKYIKCIFTDKGSLMRSKNKTVQLSKYMGLKESVELRGGRGRDSGGMALGQGLGQGEKKMQKLNDLKEKGNERVEKCKKSVGFVDEKDKQNRGRKEIPLELYIEIKQVFRYLQILKNYGFSEKKIVKWMNTFLTRKSQIICDIFLRSYLNKKSLSNSLIYQRFTAIQHIISKMEAQAEKLSQSETLFLITEIKNFKNYIEEIVIKKTESNLSEILNIGPVNPMLRFDQTSNQFINSPEVIHFVKDLKTIEDRYGRLESISKFNRVMFKQVLQAQERFIQEFYTNKNYL